MINEIEPNFFRITLRMPYRLRHVNAYLFVHGDDLVLFDTGLNAPGAVDMLEDDLKSIGWSTGNIKHVYLTHVHTDHCSMAGLIQKKSGAHVYLSRTAFEEYEHYRNADPAVCQLRKFYAGHGMPSYHIDLVIEEFESIRSTLSGFTADDYLQDNDSRAFGNRTFKIYCTPGHSFGHVCFFFPGEGYLLSGDHVLPYIAPILSPNIFDESFRPLKAYLDSFNVLEKLPVSTVFPGHGSCFNDFRERLADIRRHHEKRKSSIFGNVSERRQTAYDILNQMIAPTVSDFDKFLALNEVIIYLQELTIEGAIQEDLQDNVLVYGKG